MNVHIMVCMQYVCLFVCDFVFCKYRFFIQTLGCSGLEQEAILMFSFVLIVCLIWLGLGSYIKETVCFTH